MNGRNPIKAFFGALWRTLQALGRILKTLIILVFILFLVAGLSGGRITVPESAALIVDPTGTLVDQLQGDPFERAMAEIQDGLADETLVRDVIDSLEAAKDDDRIKTVVLRLEGLQAGGLSKLHAIGRAIGDVRAAGKKVIAMGDGYSQPQYYLAAHADEIYMHDFGFVLIDGFGYFRAYLNQAIQKLQIDVNIFRVGEYKSFVEPYLRDDMSEEDKLAGGQWLNGLWQAYQDDIVQARGLEAGALDSYADDLVLLLQQAGGDTAQVAVNAGLVDELINHQEFREKLIDVVGESGNVPGTYENIDFRSYLAALRSGPAEELKTTDNVAVIVAAGTIVDGEASPGAIGGHTMSRIVLRATEDDSVKAVVMRVDSPGGSMFASELIYDQLEALKASGKPYVVSMGSVAASGGYYIAMLADEIWASPTTLSGSIGVGALFPTFQRGLSELGIHIDGIGTTNLTGQFSPVRELGDDARQLFELATEDAYRVFISKVAASRDMDVERVDGIAQGRVWIGGDALDIGLIDALGDLDDAVDSAASLAGLAEGEYNVKYLKDELSFAERLALQFTGFVRNVAGLAGVTPTGDSSQTITKLVHMLEQRLEQLALWNDPRGLYYHCMCEVW